ncbi:hypothetical protein V6N13_052140 [Hibiscus sabdariffa]
MYTAPHMHTSQHPWSQSRMPLLPHGPLPAARLCQPHGPLPEVTLQSPDHMHKETKEVNFLQPRRRKSTVNALGLWSCSVEIAVGTAVVVRRGNDIQTIFAALGGRLWGSEEREEETESRAVLLARRSGQKSGRWQWR